MDMSPIRVRGFWMMVIGASLTVIADVLHAPTDYDNMAVAPTQHMIATVLAVIGALFHMQSAPAHGALAHAPRLGIVITKMFLLFGFMVAVVQAHNGVYYLLRNNQIIVGDTASLAAIQTQIETLTTIFMMGVTFAFIGSYGLLTVAIAMGRTVLPKSVAFVSPMILIAPLITFIDGVLRPFQSIAWPGVLFSLVIIVIGMRGRAIPR